jgi:23S rRNA (uracil1939-C5)-methyltransferase
VKRKKPILEQILVTDYAAAGRSLARIAGKVIFIEGAVPGDVVDVQLTKNKKDWAEGRAIRFHTLSSHRTQPFCQHFGTCGGCKWQMLPYEKQLAYKQQEVEQHLRRIGKVALPPLMPIVGSASTQAYRNKLEFTFSNKRYLTHEEINEGLPLAPQNALGFHVPRIFDKVIDIEECHLMDPVNNRIRNGIRSYALQEGYSFYDIKLHTGWLRNLILRYCSTGELMVNVCLGHDDPVEIPRLMDHILQVEPGITTLLYTINPKWNDTIYDLTPVVYSGKGYVMEKLDNFVFKIGPKSFFQTNTGQAQTLYRVVKEFAALNGSEVLYDLYCGTGSIGIFLSGGARKIIGVETVAEAVADAKEIAALNNLTNTEFFAGDVTDVCTDAFFAEHGRPDIVITDPPRAGMHGKLVEKLLELAAPRIVYVSCNPATQARDLALLDAAYTVEKIQPVDMFPHTHHIESVVLLQRRL